MSAFRDLMKMLKNELDKHLLPFWVEWRGKHPKLFVRFANCTRSMSLPSTPSDYRTPRNCLAQLRRMIREANAAPDGAALGRHAITACA